MNAHVSRFFGIAVVAGCSLLAANVQAACKSLEQHACTADAACTWIDSYQRADGRSVKAHCRTTPRKRDAVDLAVTAPQKAGD